MDSVRTERFSLLDASNSSTCTICTGGLTNTDVYEKDQLTKGIISRISKEKLMLTKKQNRQCSSSGPLQGKNICAIRVLSMIKYIVCQAGH